MKQRHIHRERKRFFRLRPMLVRESRTFKNGFTYAVCPGCRFSMEREYARYCSNCGQRLNWSQYE